MSNPFSFPDLVDALLVNFAAMTPPVTAGVEFGNWLPQNYEKSANKIYIGFGDGSLDVVGPPGAPGVVFSHTTDRKEFYARAIYTHVQGVKTWIQGPAADRNDPKRSQKSVQATFELLHLFIDALHMAIHGSVEPGPIRWPTIDSQQFMFGALCTFDFNIRIPVLDVPFQAVTVLNTAQTVQAVFPSGNITVSEWP